MACGLLASGCMLLPAAAPRPMVSVPQTAAAAGKASAAPKPSAHPKPPSPSAVARPPTTRARRVLPLIATSSVPAPALETSASAPPGGAPSALAAVSAGSESLESLPGGSPSPPSPLAPGPGYHDRIAPVAGAHAVSNASLVDSLSLSWPDIFSPGWPLLLVLVAALLLWAWHVRRRRRARRNALRVWNPGRAKRTVAITPELPAVDALETPPWLIDATRHQSATTAALTAEDDPLPASTPFNAGHEAPGATDPAAEPATVQAPAPPTPARTPPASTYATQMTISNLRGRLLEPTSTAPRVTLQVERYAGHAMSAPAAQPAIEEPEHERATAATAAWDTALRQARRLATQDRPSEALAILRPRLDADASASTWAMAGWCAWKLASNGRDPLPAAAEAVRAFTAALAADPSRRSALSRMVGRCHLLQADADLPAHRSVHLQAAVRAYAQGLGDCEKPSQAGLLEWAGATAALAAEAAVHERDGWLVQLDALLARGPRMTEATPAWCKLHAQSSWLHALAEPASAARSRWHAQAVAQLRVGHDRVTGSRERDRWLAESIEAERLYLGSLSQATRTAASRAMESRIRPMLAESQSAAPWLAWSRVLIDGARHLQGPAAKQRLAEAGAVFDRLESLPVSADERQAIAFARAYYLRLRGMHEHGQVRAQLLEQAARLLGQLRASPFGRPDALAMEQAEVALAQASEGQDELAHYRQAVAYASFAADSPPMRVAAFRALLTALLGWQQRLPEPARMNQIGVVAQWLGDADDPPAAESLGLLAAVAMLSGNAAEAARLSAAAWEAGAERGVVLPNWHRADAEWAKQLAEAERPVWERQHRQLRLATGSH